MRLILASTSPRRRELLSLLGVPFETADPNIPEHVIPGISCADQALRLAVEKARVCAERHPDAVVLGSDTLIELDGALIGKPVDREDAVSILRRLRGRLHLIHTAIAAARGSADAAMAVETVRVWMRGYTDEMISAYVATGEGLDKAGGYAIQGQGAALIDRIEGDFTAAVGLPLRAVATMLSRQGLPIPVDLEGLYRDRQIPNWRHFDSKSAAGPPLR